MTGAGGSSVRFKLGAIALILLSILVGALRPLVRLSGRGRNRYELSRVVFMAEPAADTQSPPANPDRITVRVFAPALISVLLLILKTQQRAAAPTPVHRLKLPRRATADSLLAD